jgi:hypothetical protein
VTDAAERLAHYRDEQFAAFLAIAIGLAARTHPEELRTAFAQVFDLAAYEDMAKRAMLVVSHAQMQATEIRELLSALDDRLEKQERWADRVHEKLMAVAKKLDRLPSNGKQEVKR